MMSQILVEKNFKQKLKKVRYTINLWRSRGLSIYRKVNIITYAPYDQGDLKMLYYENMVKASRLSWLIRIVDPDYFEE